MPNVVVPMPKETYDRLIEDALRDFRDPKNHIVYLLQVALGMREDQRATIPKFTEQEDIDRKI